MKLPRWYTVALGILLWICACPFFANASVMESLKAAYTFAHSNGNDSTPNAFNLSNVGSPTFDLEFFGTGINLGASNSANAVNTSSNLGITGGAATFCQWVNITTQPSASTERLFEQDSATPNDGFFILYKDVGGTKSVQYERIRNSVADDQCTVTLTLTTGTWFHECLTYDGTTVTGYSNGVSQCTIGSSGDGTGTGTNGFALGVTAAGAASQWTSGKIDEAEVYSRGLSANEIKQLYNGGVAGAAVSWPFSNYPAWFPF